MATKTLMIGLDGPGGADARMAENARALCPERDAPSEGDLAPRILAADAAGATDQNGLEREMEKLPPREFDVRDVQALLLTGLLDANNAETALQTARRVREIVGRLSPGARTRVFVLVAWAESPALSFLSRSDRDGARCVDCLVLPESAWIEESLFSPDRPANEPTGAAELEALEAAKLKMMGAAKFEPTGEAKGVAMNDAAVWIERLAAALALSPLSDEEFRALSSAQEDDAPIASPIVLLLQTRALVFEPDELARRLAQRVALESVAERWLCLDAADEVDVNDTAGAVDAADAGETGRKVGDAGATGRTVGDAGVTNDSSSDGRAADGKAALAKLKTDGETSFANATDNDAEDASGGAGIADTGATGRTVGDAGAKNNSSRDGRKADGKAALAKLKTDGETSFANTTDNDAEDASGGADIADAAATGRKVGDAGVTNDSSSDGRAADDKATLAKLKPDGEKSFTSATDNDAEDASGGEELDDTGVGLVSKDVGLADTSAGFVDASTDMIDAGASVIDATEGVTNHGAGVTDGGSGGGAGALAGLAFGRSEAGESVEVDEACLRNGAGAGDLATRLEELAGRAGTSAALVGAARFLRVDKPYGGGTTPRAAAWLAAVETLVERVLREEAPADLDRDLYGRLREVRDLDQVLDLAPEIECDLCGLRREVRELVKTHERAVLGRCLEALAPAEARALPFRLERLLLGDPDGPPPHPLAQRAVLAQALAALNARLDELAERGATLWEDIQAYDEIFDLEEPEDPRPGPALTAWLGERLAFIRRYFAAHSFVRDFRRESLYQESKLLDWRQARTSELALRALRERAAAMAAEAERRFAELRADSARLQGELDALEREDARRTRELAGLERASAAFHGKPDEPRQEQSETAAWRLAHGDSPGQRRLVASEPLRLKLLASLRAMFETAEAPSGPGEGLAGLFEAFGLSLTRAVGLEPGLPAEGPTMLEQLLAAGTRFARELPDLPRSLAEVPRLEADIRPRLQSQGAADCSVVGRILALATPNEQENARSNESGLARRWLGHPDCLAASGDAAGAPWENHGAFAASPCCSERELFYLTLRRT